MANARLLGRDSKKSFIGKIQNATTYQFKDSLTGLDADINDLIDKNDLTQYNSKIKGTDDDLQWDSIVFENLEDKDLDLQVKAILDSYDHPDFHWQKDPGSGRAIQDIHVVGERPVYYDLHKDEFGNHLHLKVFRWAIDKQNNKVALAPNEIPKVADAQFAYTNQILADRGLPSIGTPNKAFSNSPNKATEETKHEAKQIINEALNIEEVAEKITSSTSYDESKLDTALSADEKELARLLQLAKQKQEEINAKKASKELIEDNRKLKFVLGEKEKEIEGLHFEKNAVAEQLENRNKALKEVIDVMGITEYELGESGLSHSEYVKAKLEEKDIDYSNLEEELQGVKAEAVKTLADTIAQKDIEKQTAINEIKADFTDKLIAKDELIAEKEVELKEKKIETGKVKIELESTKKVKESLEIQVAEAHKKNADLLSNNNSLANNNKALQAEIEKLKADNAKQMEAFKKEQDEANKKLIEEKAKTAKLEKENEEKDKKFREFASKFVNEVGDKLKHLSASIQKLAKGITDPEHKKEANDIAKSVKTSISDLTKQYGANDKPKAEDNQGNQNNPFNPNKKKF